MRHEYDSFEATLAMAAGDDQGLADELRRTFADSVARQVDLLKRARCDGNWLVAAQRLKSLASSFFAQELIELADLAIESAPGDPVAVRRLEDFVSDMRTGQN
ncbi:Hpt domain-containing protein [Qipengyuania sp. JC766]|uniref:Hpt domain-containing protein n=1 Tax=Qipengyuania sp. JC766 TaxID=3232139 RepID=UPI00345B1E27